MGQNIKAGFLFVYWFRQPRIIYTRGHAPMRILAFFLRKKAFKIPRMKTPAIRTLKYVILAPLVLAAAFWFAIRMFAGEKVANQTAAAVFQRPIELQNVIRNLPAHSQQYLHLILPYTGFLSLEITVLKGNNIQVYLVNAEQLEKAKAGESFDHLINFVGKDIINYQREGRLRAGNYYVLIKDKTFGILSESSSDVRILATLSP